MKTRQTIKIAIVEDDAFFRKSLTKYMETLCDRKLHSGYDFDIKSFGEAETAIQELEDDLDIMVLDYYFFHEMNGEQLTGEDVLMTVKKHCPNCKVILMSEQTDPSVAVRLIEKGIYEYIDKNVNSKNRLGAIIQRSIQEVKQRA